MDKINLLVNLPGGFYKTAALKPIFARLNGFANVRRRSYNTAEEIGKDLAWADAVLMWSWPKLMPDLLDAAPKLKFAAQLDISQSAAKVALERGFPVSQGRSAWSPAVAEMALTLTLAVLRKTSDYHARMRVAKETWVGSFPDSIDPLERQLTGRPVAIVGFGQIGRRLRELLAPFGGEVRAVDPFVTPEAMQQQNVLKADLLGAIKASDVVVICAASNAGTKHLIGAREIRAFRKNAVLVNCARAALVDTDALVARLKKGDMFAAVDVFDQEPLAKNHPLRKLPNAYLTPHRAGGVMASVERILTYLIDDLEAHLAGKPRKYALTEAMVGALDA
jgi:phosphoglycerate dehydrogenase-like enzyme